MCRQGGTAQVVSVFHLSAHNITEYTCLALGTGHPTITDPETGLQVLQRFRSQYREPLPHEGYTRISRITPSDLPNDECTEEDVRNVMRRLQETSAVVPTSPPTFFKGYDRGYRGNYASNSQRGFQPRGSPSYRDGHSARGARRGTETYQSTIDRSRQHPGD